MGYEPGKHVTVSSMLILGISDAKTIPPIITSLKKKNSTRFTVVLIAIAIQNRSRQNGYRIIPRGYVN